MIDTHTHIYLEEFDEDRIEVVRRAREAGVERVILPNVDFDTGASHACHERFVSRLLPYGYGATPHVGGGRLSGAAWTGERAAFLRGVLRRG